MRAARGSISPCVQALGAAGALLGLSGLAGCGGSAAGDPSALGCDPAAPPAQTASCVLAFEPGGGAGVGLDAFPEVVFGGPEGRGASEGSLDVLSLGWGGSIALGFGGEAIVDGEGPDFVVFENPFLVGGDPEKPFAELGEVSVSEDGERWISFPCRAEAYPFEGCAGWRAVFAGPESGISPFDRERAGGDPFDLAEVGIARARFVRVRDLSGRGAAPSAGFDLDAVAVLSGASGASGAPP